MHCVNNHLRTYLLTEYGSGMQWACDWLLWVTWRQVRAVRPRSSRPGAVRWDRATATRCRTSAATSAPHTSTTDTRPVRHAVFCLFHMTYFYAPISTILYRECYDVQNKIRLVYPVSCTAVCSYVKSWGGPSKFLGVRTPLTSSQWLRPRVGVCNAHFNTL